MKREQIEKENKTKLEHLEKEEGLKREMIERADRQKRELQRDERKEDEQLRSKEKLLITLKEAQPVVPQTVNISKLILPKMTDKNDPVVFIRYLETALIRTKVPQDQWKDYVQPQMTLQAGERIIDVLEREDCTFEEIKAALTGVDSMSFASTAEAFFNLFEGGVKLRQKLLAERLKGWIKKLIQEAETEADIIEKFTVACLRLTLSQDLKNYLDLTETSTLHRYLIKIDEWEKCRAEVRPIYKHDSSEKYMAKGTRDGAGFKKDTCFHCGKVGHVSRECRTRLAAEKQSSPRQSQVDAAMPTPITLTKPEKKLIVCFVCHQKGHMSPQCPQKVPGVKRIQIPINKVVPLKQNEVFGTIEGHVLPITCDSGADITVVPEECISDSQFTGES